MGKLFNQTHRKVYGEKSVKLSILSVGVLIFNQFFSEKGISIQFMIIGLIIFTVGIIISYFFLRDVRGGEK